MTLTKNKMVRAIGQRTRLKNRDIQLMLEALAEVWIESIVEGERIELENLFVLETQFIDRGNSGGVLNGNPVPRYIRRLTLRTSKRLKKLLNSP
jgi:hypothetical protein